MARKAGWLEQASAKATVWAGSSLAFGLAFGVILVWAVTGPIFDYSNTWQLVINTGTTIVTFLMVFLIQRSQNKDSQAVHLKLNELVAAMGGASNRLISAEDLTEDEVKVLREHFRKLVELAKLEGDVTCSHSIEEAEADHAWKKAAREAEKVGREPRARKKRKKDKKKRADTKADPTTRQNGDFAVRYTIPGKPDA
jgi:low affinity Fe/Cu permease